jgi:predicted DNA-binding transcriptional regulator YafY
MRHDKAESLLRLALDLQGSAEGLTLADIQDRFEVSRRTAERMRDAVERLIPQMDQANPGEIPKRWRIQKDFLSGLAVLDANDLATLETASKTLMRLNMQEPAEKLALLRQKLAAKIKPEQQRRMAPDAAFWDSVVAVTERPGPRVVIRQEILESLRKAIISDHRISLSYRGRESGKLSRQLVEPYGFLYGTRPYLVAFSTGARGFRLWSLANIENLIETEEVFTRNPAFELSVYAAKSFGVFQEEPQNIVLRFAPEAAKEAQSHQFHPSQTFEKSKDGSLIVRFQAGGLLEMCWHLFTWGDAVTILEPTSLRERMKEELTRARASCQKRRLPQAS